MLCGFVGRWPGRGGRQNQFRRGNGESRAGGSGAASRLRGIAGIAGDTAVSRAGKVSRRTRRGPDARGLLHQLGSQGRHRGCFGSGARRSGRRSRDHGSRGRPARFCDRQRPRFAETLRPQLREPHRACSDQGRLQLRRLPRGRRRKERVQAHPARLRPGRGLPGSDAPGAGPAHQQDRARPQPDFAQADAHDCPRRRKALRRSIPRVRDSVLVDCRRHATAGP